MTKLPQVSGAECVRALQRAGFYIHRQKGSHVILKRGLPPARAVVPMHRELKKGTLRTILDDAGLTVEQFIDLL